MRWCDRRGLCVVEDGRVGLEELYSTDCVVDGAVVEDVDLFMDSFCVSDCGEADWIGS